ncbi:MAG: salicylate esterase [Betaproteobacteria bacterium]|nr:salicylate esterase [Betaproteobacteria bacterium]
MTIPKTYVLTHGSWHGAWCWRHVVPLLTAAGHRVHTLSFTGMGDRAHLLNAGITVETFVQDIVSLIESEELEDAVLVAHSFGGIPVTGAADRLRGRLSRVVYLDAALVESGQCAFDTYPPADVRARTLAAQQAGGVALPVPRVLSPIWGLTPDMPDYPWFMRRLTPHPLATYTTPIHYSGAPGGGAAVTYVECTAPQNPLIGSARALAAAQAGWNYVKMAAPHEMMITHPRETAELLLAS